MIGNNPSLLKADMSKGKDAIQQAQTELEAISQSETQVTTTSSYLHHILIMTCEWSSLQIIGDNVSLNGYEKLETFM
jgi:transaldolase